ncbi:MAG: hypothetical protein KC550_02845, partial [Nanoarchaeota archaeon]|nr:hypothetical protein [Nanoarchaeota archaeon]
GKISDWNINVYDNKKSNVYVQSNYKVESILNSHREQIVFTVYKEFSDDTLGSSSFTLNISEEVSKFDKELEDAIFICSQGKSKKYTLPSNKDEFVKDENINYDDFYSKKFEKDFGSNSLNLFFEEKIGIFKTLIEKEKQYGMKLNYIEFMNNFSKSSLETSKKISKSTKRNSSYMEFVLSARLNENEEEREYIVYHDINDLYSFDFNKFFKSTIESCKNSILAKNASSFEGEVVLSGTAANDFFNPDLTMNSIIAHCGARLKFLKISKFEKGKEILNFKCDKISVYSNPLLKGNMGSSPYDDLGVSAKKICLIEKGIFKNNFAGKQYADYLNIKPTGPFGVIEIEGGSSSKNELLTSKNDIYEIDSFSSFVPDVVSGDFSAEIRLGFIIRNGKKIPFKGGLFSGNIFKILEEVKLSKEKINLKGYYGPEVIKFMKGEIIGLN